MFTTDILMLTPPHPPKSHLGSPVLQAEGDGVAAKLLATRRETMRLRSKIRELKQQHAELQEIKEAHQQQLQAAMIDRPHGERTLGQGVLCQLPGVQSNAGAADVSAGSHSAKSVVAESACESVQAPEYSNGDSEQLPGL